MQHSFKLKCTAHFRSSTLKECDVMNDQQTTLFPAQIFSKSYLKIMGNILQFTVILTELQVSATSNYIRLSWSMRSLLRSYGYIKMSPLCFHNFSFIQWDTSASNFLLLPLLFLLSQIDLSFTQVSKDTAKSIVMSSWSKSDSLLGSLTF